MTNEIVNTISPYNLPESFYDFALMPKFEQNIESLASMAETEDWNYKYAPNTSSLPMLQTYIKYTYRRIAEEKKVAVTKDEKYACWNTGLITPHQEPIYILFEENKFPNRRSYWHFLKFARRGEWDLNKFLTLPEMAHYFEDPSCVVYDTRKELRSNIEHIISDNRERFPAELQAMNNYALQNIVKGAIDSVLERVKRNYKTAIPQYYDGSVQLLLPLCLTDAAKADLALVVERFHEFYRASTCLTLGALKNQVQHFWRKMLHGKNIQAVEY